MSENKELGFPPEVEPRNSSEPASEKRESSTSSPVNQAALNKEDDLPEVRGPVPRKVWLVQFIYFLERATFYGVSQPLQNYLQLAPDNPDRPGAIGLGQSRAVLFLYIWFVYSYSTPLLGGLIADCWLGRRKTIQIGLFTYILGVSIVTATAFTNRIYGVGGFPGLIVGMLLVGASTGTVKPNITVFLIDQLPKAEPEQDLQVVTLKNGKSARVSRKLTERFIWNVNYWMINVGASFGIITTNLERYTYYGFGAAFTFCLGLIATSTLLFNIGYKHFETAPPTGNAIANVYNALRRRRSSIHPGDAPSQSSDVEDGSDTKAEDAATISEAKSALRACLVFIPFPALMLSINLMDSTLIAQAGTMQTHGLPNDIMFNLNPISVMVFLPFFQSLLYPYLAKKKINFSPEHRIGAGMFCAALALAYTTGIQKLIYSTGPCFSYPLACLGGNVPNDVSVGLQTPTYVFLGWAEILAIVSGTELAYSRAPASMKSIVQSLFNMFSALGGVLGIAVSFAAYNPNMVIVYASLTALLVAVTLGFEMSYVVRGKSTSS